MKGRVHTADKLKRARNVLRRSSQRKSTKAKINEVINNFEIVLHYATSFGSMSLPERSLLRAKKVVFLRWKTPSSAASKWMIWRLTGSCRLCACCDAHSENKRGKNRRAGPKERGAQEEKAKKKLDFSVSFLPFLSGFL